MALLQISEPGQSPDPHQRRIAVGIDLGTTHSLVAAVKSGVAECLPDAQGRLLLPSVVRYLQGGGRQIGYEAVLAQAQDARNTVASAKRFMGRALADIAGADKLPYDFVQESGQGGMVSLATADGVKSPVEVSAEILATLRQRAEDSFGADLYGAVITVPAYFDDSQRQATKDAGKIAGLEVKRIINEPTAASLAYGLEGKKDEKIAVFDLGGGTFDVSILELGDGVFEVRSTNGDTHLGGEDFDNRIVNHFLEVFKKEEGVDLKSDKAAMQRLKDEAEKAKKELSTTTETEINLPFITADADGPKHFEYKMTRAKLEELVADLVDRLAKPVEKALKDADMKASDINEIVLVGGMTRMPAVVEKVKAIFGKDPLKGVNPDEVVAVGAAIQGGVLAGDVKDVLLLDVTPLSLGIETMGGVSTKLIERNSTIPTSKSETFSTAADNQPQVEIHVLQGEREMANDNKSLGRFILDGIAPAPRGVPQIEVTFNLDANGILNVTAKDKGTGKEQSITIQDSGNMSKEDIEKAQKDAEAHADEDKKKREAIDARNALENAIYQAEKMPSEYKDKISDEDKKAIETAVETAKKVKDDEKADKDALEAAAKALTDTIMPIGAKLYEAAAKESDDADKGEDDKKADGKSKKSKKDKDEPVEGEVVDEK